MTSPKDDALEELLDRVRDAVAGAPRSDRSGRTTEDHLDALERSLLAYEAAPDPRGALVNRLLRALHADAADDQELEALADYYSESPRAYVGGRDALIQRGWRVVTLERIHGSVGSAPRTSMAPPHFTEGPRPPPEGCPGCRREQDAPMYLLSGHTCGQAPLERLSRTRGKTRMRDARAQAFPGPGGAPCAKCASTDTGEASQEVQVEVGVSHGCRACGYAWAAPGFVLAELPAPPDVGTPEGLAWLRKLVLRFVHELPGIAGDEILHHVKERTPRSYIGSYPPKRARALLDELVEEGVLGWRPQRLPGAPLRYWPKARRNGRPGGALGHLTVRSLDSYESGGPDQPAVLLDAASVPEHRAAILRYVGLCGHWPTKARVRARLRFYNLRYHTAHFELAWDSVRLTNGQWAELGSYGAEGFAGRVRVNRFTAQVQDALVDKGLAEILYVGMADERCVLTESGRDRLRLGRGP